MKAKRPFATLMTLVLFASVFAAGPAAAAQDQCDQGNTAAQVGNVNLDLNVNAGNVAVNAPVLSPNVGSGDQTADATQQINDRNDDFQSQSNRC